MVSPTALSTSACERNPLPFTSAAQVSLSLRWPDAGTVALADFASVSVQREPTWSSDGGWNTPTSRVTPTVAFGVVLPFEDVFISAGGSHASDVHTMAMSVLWVLLVL